MNYFFNSYAQRVRLASNRFRDQLNSPLETAMHWVKHVAKNKGAPHLRSVAVILPFYKLYNLDVWAFVLFTVIVVAFLIQKAFAIICHGWKKKTKIA